MLTTKNQVLWSSTAFAVGLALAILGCGSDRAPKSAVDTAPVVSLTTREAGWTDPATTPEATTATASTRNLEFEFSNSHGWHYSGSIPVPELSLTVSDDISSSPPGFTKIMIARKGTVWENPVFQVDNPGRPDGPELLAYPGWLYFPIKPTENGAALTGTDCENIGFYDQYSWQRYYAKTFGWKEALRCEPLGPDDAAADGAVVQTADESTAESDVIRLRDRLDGVTPTFVFALRPGPIRDCDVVVTPDNRVYTTFDDDDDDACGSFTGTVVDSAGESLEPDTPDPADDPLDDMDPAALLSEESRCTADEQVSGPSQSMKHVGTKVSKSVTVRCAASAMKSFELNVAASPDHARRLQREALGPAALARLRHTGKRITTLPIPSDVDDDPTCIAVQEAARRYEVCGVARGRLYAQIESRDGAAGEDGGLRGVKAVQDWF